MLNRFLTFLGHGRALEAYLAGSKILFISFLLPSNYTVHIAALEDLKFIYPEPLLTLPLVMVGVFQCIGLYLNAKGYEISWLVRATAALVAILIWSAFITKSIWIVSFGGIFPFACMSFLASVFILWKALNRLPVPGALGLR